MTRKASLKKSCAGTKKTLILGIGNTIRGDDAAGILAVRALSKSLDKALKRCVDIREVEDSGVNLLELLSAGYEKVVLVDSVSTKNANPGTIYNLTKESFSRKIADYATHQFGIPAFLAMAEGLKLAMPKKLKLYAVEIEPRDDFSIQLSPVIKDAVERLVKLLRKEISY